MKSESERSMEKGFRLSFGAEQASEDGRRLNNLSEKK